MNNIFASITKGAKFSSKTKPLQNFMKKDSGKAESKFVTDLFSVKKCAESDDGDEGSMEENASSASGDSSGDEEEDGRGSDKKKSKTFDREDELNGFRNKMNIKVKGTDIAPPCTSFESMNIDQSIKDTVLDNIEVGLWKEPTPIQMQAIPSMLARRDILATAPTGSGKTAAFVIPALSRLAETRSTGGLRVLLLAPTKELADQIHREAQRLIQGKRFKIYLLKKKGIAGAIAAQGKSSFNKYDMLIATPLRLLSLIRAGCIDLSQVQTICMDEADKLFELDTHGGGDHSRGGNSDDGGAEGSDDEDEDEDDSDGEAKASSAPLERVRSSFLSQVDEILAECPSDRSRLQRCLFSATIGPLVRELAESFLSNPVEVSVGVENAGASSIDQKLVFVGREDGKILGIRQLVQQGLKPPVLIFVQSIDRAKDLLRELVYDGINVDVMHASRSQQQREDVIRRFRIGEIWVLICTDLMARGIDFKGVQMVINYDLPLTGVSYIHRIGRTGRAGRTGCAVTFYTEEDIPRMRSIANVVKLSGCPVPEWMLAIKQLNTKQKKQLRHSAPKRHFISDKASSSSSSAHHAGGDEVGAHIGVGKPSAGGAKKKRSNGQISMTSAGTSNGGSSSHNIGNHASNKKSRTDGQTQKKEKQHSKR